MKTRAPKLIEPEEIRSAVHQMVQTDAFMHLCAAFQRKVQAEVVAKGMNPKTPDTETLVLKKTQEVLEQFTPEALANELMQGATNEIERLNQGK